MFAGFAVYHMEYPPDPVVGVDPGLPGGNLADLTPGYVPLLPDLFSLWVPGDLQIWSN